MSSPNDRDIMARAIRQIRNLQGKLAAAEENHDVAIVGIGCRLPGAERDIAGANAMLTALHAGENGIRDVPAERWPESYSGSQQGAAARMTSGRGGFLRDVEHFDPSLLCVAPRDAHTVDPQQALICEAAQQAIADAGYDPRSLRGNSCGVFVGLSSFDYALLQAQGDPFGEEINAASLLGVSPSLCPNRLSFALGLEGPSMAVDTACSSGLYALHAAIHSLRNRECDAALVGGVNVILSPTGGIFFSKLGALAKDGHCKTYDDSADGMVRSEGCVVLMLRPLRAALHDNDAIYAVVRGSATNHDGIKAGLVAPRRQGQERVIRAAWTDAGRQPGDAAFFETHGTGTLLGDQIELQALGDAIGADADRRYWVSSVKGNIGHTEAAAGLVGVVRAALTLTTRQLPRQLHFATPSKNIPWDRLPFDVPQETVCLQTEQPLLAGVSSFGIGGANAHVVLESAPVAQQERKRHPLPPAKRDTYRPAYTRVRMPATVSARAAHPLLHECIALVNGGMVCRGVLHPQAGLFAEHQIRQRTVVPAASHVLQMLGAAAATMQRPARAIRLSDIEFLRPWWTHATVPQEVQVLVQPDEGKWQLELASAVAGEWVTHARARATLTAAPPADEAMPDIAAHNPPKEGDAFYKSLQARGYDLTGDFARLQRVCEGRGATAVADVAGCAGRMSAGVLDSCWHTAAACMPDAPLLLPVAIEHMWVDPEACGGRLRVEASLTSTSTTVRVWNSEGRLVCVTEGLTARPAPDVDTTDASPFWLSRWEPRPFKLQDAVAQGRRLLLIASNSHAGAQALARQAADAGWDVAWQADVSLAHQNDADAIAVFPLRSADAVESDAPPDWKGLQSLLSRDLRGARVWMVGHHARPRIDTHTPLNPRQMALAAMTTALRAEFPHAEISYVDIPEGNCAASIANLRRLITAAPQAAEFIIDREGLKSLGFAPTQEAARPPRIALDPKGLYILCGAGRVARAFAQTLAQHGARHLLCMSRRAPTGASMAVFDALRAQGVDVRHIRVDAADATSLGAAWQSVRDALPPPRGVIHAAGVLADKSFLQMGDSEFNATWNGRAKAAVHLHELFADAPLEHFIVCGSAAATLGSPGQANYAAACGYLEGLMLQRRAANLPGCIVHFGPWADEGLAYNRAATTALLARGVPLLDESCTAAVLGQACGDRISAISVLPGSSAQWRGLTDRTARRRREAVASPIAREHAHEAVADAVAAVLGMPKADLDCGRSLSELGLTSLMAMELREEIRVRCGVHLAATAAYAYPTVDALAQAVRGQLPERLADSTASDEDIEARLLKKINEVGPQP